MLKRCSMLISSPRIPPPSNIHMHIPKGKEVVAKKHKISLMRDVVLSQLRKRLLREGLYKDSQLRKRLLREGLNKGSAGRKEDEGGAGGLKDWDLSEVKMPFLEQRLCRRIIETRRDDDHNVVSLPSVSSYLLSLTL